MKGGHIVKSKKGTKSMHPIGDGQFVEQNSLSTRLGSGM